MLLESLAGSAAREGAGTESGLLRQRVHWRLDVDSAGRPLGPVVPVGDSPTGVELEIPGTRRTSADSARVLDKGDYTLGVDASEKAPGRAARRRELWGELIEQMHGDVDDPVVAGLAAFARNRPEVVVPDGYNPQQFLAVYVTGALASELPAVRAWWRSRLAGTARHGDVGQCGVCGLMAPIPKRMPVAVRGLSRIGGKAEMSLVSANSDAFEHHGLGEATTARVCNDCGESTHHRLNSLIASDANRRFQSDVVMVWWSNVDTSDLITALFEGIRPADVAHLLTGPWRGVAGGVGDPGRFDAAVFGASVARVVVRSWVSETIADLATNVDRWFDDTAMVGRTGGELTSPGLGLLAVCLRPPGARSSAGPDMHAQLFACAVQGTRMPDSAAQAVLRRIGADRQISHPRAALLRCWLVRRNLAMPRVLHESVTDPAYATGRLLALLDEAAHAATGASLLDRYYTQLSSHPGLVVGRLIDLHQHHLAKLRRDRPGQAARIQREVEEVVEGVETFPAHLDLEGRARFALGVYHEQAAQRARRAHRSDRRPAAGDVPVDNEQTEEIQS